MSFLAEFFNIAETDEEYNVNCPFPHHTDSGLLYQETHPSAHVNPGKKVFHCKACGVGYSEPQFIEHILGCSTIDAIRILKYFDSDESKPIWVATRHLEDETQALANNLGINNDVLKELSVTTPIGDVNAMQFPVFLYNQLMDIRTYKPGGHPKMKSRAGSMNGLIIPYDIWVETPENLVTVFCAGEKDMAVARSHGLNAITLTGGEEALPRITNAFKNRIIAICYDNDNAGKKGAKHLANELLKYTPYVKVVTGFHEICVNDKEDITDFFVKYGKTKEDLVEYIRATEFYKPDPEETKQITYQMCDLYTASLPENIKHMKQSNIQVVAVSDTTFTVPASILLEKTKLSGDKDTMAVGECREWELTNDTVQDTLHMMDNNFKEETIKENIRELLWVRKTERFVKQRTLGTKTVFKANVTDLFETDAENTVPMEYTAYSFGQRLEAGQKYLVTYKLVPHPYKGQQLVMLITDAKQANDSVSNFTITEEAKEQLDLFKAIPGTVTEKIDTLTEKVKGLLGYNGNNTLIQAIDFSYHTALQFNLGSFKDVRGYLDTLIVGESRTGKSSTANTLRKEYGLGVFTSLAGNSATIAGLIGGSNKTPTGFQTRAGVIPQNHRGLVIFEEFGKCKQDVVSELTDIRSSNEVRIARVSGTITLPALVRMIALTNAKTTGGNIKPIATYPNGISVVTELVGTAEDIARYDLILVLSDRGNSQVDPFWEPAEPMPTAAYQTRIRWIWSRTPEQISISKDVGLYIMERANALNTEFDSHIKLFGTEAWKKLTRLAIAVAGYVVSTDDSYENIVVTKEHVDYAEKYFRDIYDNQTFKLKQYVANERLYSTIDADGIAALQDIYTKYPALILQLEKTAVSSKNMLASAAGLSADDLNKALSRLTKCLFIQYQGYDIVPTERFRIGFSKINQETTIPRVGEQ